MFSETKGRGGDGGLKQPSAAVCSGFTRGEIMGNWEKVFNRKLTFCCNASVVRGRLTQPVSLEHGGLPLAIFFLQSSTAG